MGDLLTDSPKLYGDNTFLRAQFESSDLSGPDYGEWDFLIDRYLPLPDPG
jgi:hypothetical protein